MRASYADDRGSWEGGGKGKRKKKKKGGGQIKANNDKQKKDLASTEGSKSALH